MHREQFRLEALKLARTYARYCMSALLTQFLRPANGGAIHRLEKNELASYSYGYVGLRVLLLDITLIIQAEAVVVVAVFGTVSICFSLSLFYVVALFGKLNA